VVGQFEAVRGRRGTAVLWSPAFLFPRGFLLRGGSLGGDTSIVRLLPHMLHDARHGTRVTFDTCSDARRRRLDAETMLAEPWAMIAETHVRCAAASVFSSVGESSEDSA
jgi:hypothetical protein